MDGVRDLGPAGENLPEFIAYAKANPGKLRYGSGGVGGALHIAVEELKLKTGIDLVHVPYRGGGQAATDAMAGQIDMVSLGFPVRASPRAASFRFWRRPGRAGIRCFPTCRPRQNTACPRFAWTPGSA